MEKVVEDVHSRMEIEYPGYRRDQVKVLVDILTEAKDYKDFCVPFELAWRLVGYTRKRNAKRALTQKGEGSLGLIEGEDYIFVDEYTPTQVRVLAGLGAKNESRGLRATSVRGRPSEKIMMTPRCFGQFAMSVRTPQGQMYRDFALNMIYGVRRLKTAIDEGKVELRVRSPAPTTNCATYRDYKRLKVCESQKALMSVVVTKHGANSGTCAAINGMTNKAVTGRYKYETARMLQKKPKEVNARDYMTPGQLALAEAAEILSRERMTKTGVNDSPVQTHEDTLIRLRSATELVRGQIADEPRQLHDIRQEHKSKKEDKVEDLPYQATKITRFFSSRT